MTQQPGTVWLVDDDPAVLKALARLLRSHGLMVEAFSASTEVLSRAPEDIADCLVTDLRMPGVDGLDLQTALRERLPELPVIFLTGHGDVPSSVGALKAGAIDFLTKPCDEQVLLAAVGRALELRRATCLARATRAELEARFARLTARERQVCERVAQGRLNKEIAADLGTGEKTIKVHRARALQKLEVTSVAELVRLVDRWLARRPPHLG